MDGQQQRYLAEPMLNNSTGTPPVSQPPRVVDYSQQQRYWQQQEYEMYRAQQLLAQQMPSQMPHMPSQAPQPSIQMQMPPRLPLQQQQQPQMGQPVYVARPPPENYEQEEYEMMAAKPPARPAKIARQSLSHESPRLETPSSVSPDESEQNLKSIALESLQFPIEQTAAHVREDDSSSLAEKSRQVFGMSWLLRSCEEKQDANIPRNRIYAYYVASCDEFKLKPLNHATFGKLVRVVFPNIKTRRLGVRGQSKYHYCGITLHQNVAALTRTPSPNATPQGSLIESFSPNSYKTESPDTSAPTGLLPSAQQQAVSSTPAVAPAVHSGPALKFSDTIWGYLNGDIPKFSVPPLTEYVDPSCDPDSVATLFGLYKSHCRSLIVPFKQLQIQSFLKLHNSFLGNVTVPVQRVLKREDTVAWLLECDRCLFAELALILAPLSLKPMMPEEVHALKQLNASLIPCVLQDRNSMPESYINGKQALSEEFIQLSMRLLAANDSAQNVLSLFMNPNDASAMKSDWLRLVSTAAAQDAPCISPQAAHSIFLEEVPRLLDNQQDGLWMSMQFLTRLRDQFPCSSTMFLLSFSAVATNVLKDMTRGNAASFGCWWIYRTWADDWLGWAIRLVDFINHKKA